MKDGNAGNIDSAAKSLEEAPHLDEKADELKERLKLLLIQAKQFSAVPTASPPTEKTKPAPDELTKEFGAWRKEYNQWLKTNGRNHSGLSGLK
jgi:hypothetical protein